ncbi:MAG TPA: type VI secretion system tube protein Hcp [Conexibacter sp.]|nr:type VI secretion system tube protein Hcp [Conexibacter sp.]
MSQEEANRIARAVQRVRRTRNAGLKFALPTAAVLGAGAAVAIGSIPGGNGTITGCYLTDVANAPGLRYGQLRVIDTSQPAALPGGGPNPQGACLPDEQTITWNQRGPQGPQGVAGARGLQGAPLIGETTFGLKNDGGGTFLEIQGIKGESTDHKHKGEIVVESFSLVGGGGTSAHGSGGGAGKTISSFEITKKLDKASPLLFKAAATGQHYKEVTLSFAHRHHGAQQDYLQFKFFDVLISGVQQGVGHSQSPQEAITFNFAKVNETFLSGSGKPIQKISINVGIDKKA